MRNPANRFLLSLALVATFAFTGCDDDDDANMMQPTGMAMVRVGHLSPDTPAVDVLVNDAVVLQDVPFTAFSNYLELAAGTYNVKVTPANQNSVVAIEANVTVAADVAYTVIATGLSGDDSLGASVLVDDLSRSASNARVRFVHASPGTPNVDITLADGTVLFDDVPFGAADESMLTVPGGSYDLQARVANTSTVALWFTDVPLASNLVYTVYAIGELGDGSLRAVVTVDDAMAGNATVELDPATTQLRVAHLSPDAPNVDVWLDGAVVGALVNVPFGAVSDYLTVSAATHRVQVFVTGSVVDPVIDATLTLDPREATTVAAKGEAAFLGQPENPRALSAEVILYDGSEPQAGQALVRFAHASPDAPTVDVRVADGGPTLFSGASFRDVTAFSDVAAGTYDLEVVVSGTENVALSLPGVAFGGGQVVTVFAIGLAGEESLDALPVLD